MRRASLLLFLPLVACSGLTLPGRDPAPPAANGAIVSTETPPAASAPPPASRPAPHPAARSSAPIYVPPSADAADPGPDRLTQARADCWMQVEHQKLRDLDRRITFVDKCVADTMKKQ